MPCGKVFQCEIGKVSSVGYTHRNEAAGYIHGPGGVHNLASLTWLGCTLMWGLTLTQVL